jgi:hypothetical protein
MATRRLLFGQRWAYAGSEEQMANITSAYDEDGSAVANVLSQMPEALESDVDPMVRFREGIARRVRLAVTMQAADTASQQASPWVDTLVAAARDGLATQIQQQLASGTLPVNLMGGLPVALP